MEPVQRLSEELVQIINAYIREYGIESYKIVGLLEIIKADYIMLTAEEIDDDKQTR